ncbi:hypothetical protein G6R29_04845 [Fructobacillus sp. M2-14]|uniref:Septation ring formation regulator EzrA n=1 Tax=Fructobacillus broussonetiae TaxID=2713173 RepID=A0ABS5R477_9LACO|nr:septation ring formation regulator EzrA [Fructobacillus broussonetiae]MBS9338952.1 hypothetical protein [Fructobacillus broussonetiae]
MVIIVGLIIVLLVFALVAWAILTQRKAAGQVADFELAKKALLDERVQDEIKKAKKISLTGQALREYQTIQGQYQYLKDRFNKIDQEQYKAQKLTGGLNVWGTKKALRTLLSLSKEASQVQASIKDGLDNLYQQNDRHHAAIRQFHEERPAIVERIKSEPESFGPATDKLLDFVQQGEESYQEYLGLVEAEKAVEAAEAFEALGMEAGQVTHFMQAIPMLLSQLNGKFAEQVEEIQNGAEELRQRGVVLDEDVVKDGLAFVEEEKNKELSAIEELKVKEASETASAIEEKIQSLYDMMEAELAAYHRYFKQQEFIQKGFDRVKEQNHSLMIELAYLKSRFTLSHEEEEQQQTYENEIQGMVEGQKEVADALADKTMTYSKALERQSHWVLLLKELDRDQIALYKQIQTFQPALKSAKQRAQDDVASLKDLKRTLERRDLPGLPKVFLDHFFALSDEMERLETSLEASQVDLDDVQRQVNIVSSDLDTLKDEAKIVAEQAELSVTLVQYASRYREDNAKMAQALSEAKDLYEKDFDYAAVVEKVKTALNEVEPDAYARLVANQDPVDL